MKCHCGSGMQHKKCCGLKIDETFKCVDCKKRFPYSELRVVQLIRSCKRGKNKRLLCCPKCSEKRIPSEAIYPDYNKLEKQEK